VPDATGLLCGLDFATLCRMVMERGSCAESSMVWRSWIARLFCAVVMSVMLAAACGGRTGPVAADVVGDVEPKAADVEPETADVEPELTCLPACEGRDCGDDGCGGTCGSGFYCGGAAAPGLCLDDGTCCLQQCLGRFCGDDGCGGDCGVCGEWGECLEGACHYTPGWTVLIYAMGDNDLEGSMLGQVNQLMTVGSNENLNLVMQIDYIEGTGTRSSDWKEVDLVGVQRLLIGKGEVEVLEELEELDSADPQNLADFIKWGVESFPARRYLLILDDHGAGYSGLGSDWTSHSWMPLPRLTEGLEEGLVRAGLEEFDILFFYACLMGNYEVADAVQPFARYMMASEEIAIGSSFRLDRLQLAHDDPDVPADTLALALMEDYVPTWASAYPNVTVSLTDLEALPIFAESLSALLTALAADMGDIVGDILVARYLAEKFASMPYEWASRHLVDLGGFLHGLALLRPDLADSLADTLAAYDAMVVESYAGPGHEGATGLSVFFPPSPGFYHEVGEWQDTSPGEQYEAIGPPEAWHDFLMAILEHVEIEHLGPVFACVKEDDPNPICQDQEWVVEGEDSLVLSYPLELANLTEGFQAWMLFGEFPGSMGWSAQIDFYTEFPIAIDQETGMVTGTFDYHRLVLRQGEKESFGYWRLEENDEGTELTVPFVYLVSGAEQLEHVEWRAMVTPETWEVVESTLFLRTADGSFEVLEPAKGSKLYPAVQRLDMEWYLYDWAPLFTAFDPDGPISVAFEPLETCRTYLYSLYVEDEIGRNDNIVAYRCKGKGEPEFQVGVVVTAEGTWDEDGAPDLAATLTAGEEPPVEWETVADSFTAEFETQVTKVKDVKFHLKVVEVDEGEKETVFDGQVSKFFSQANWMCQRTKVWKEEYEGTDRTSTVKLTVDKCQ